MKKLLYAIMLFALCLACTDRQTARRLDRAQSLADSLPAEARGILDSLRPQLSGLSRSLLMRYHLTRIQADNLLDSTLHEDSLMRQVAEYYDDHGTANERMLAYYLLGRTYSDMGEAPQALQAFHDAIDRADTTSSDCDWHKLSVIHSQAGSLYSKQALPQNDIKQLSLAAHYAIKDKDTLTAVLYNMYIASSYYTLGKRDTAILIFKKIAKFYEERGNKANAAVAHGAMVPIYIDEYKFVEARENMNIYERESGFFDKSGEIASGHEIYYYSKGMYYIYVNKIDSAEHYFRKLLKTGKDHNEQIAASQGLCKIYNILGNNDSVAKYSQYSYRLNDSAYIQANARTLQQMQASYDFSYHQKEAEHQRLLANKHLFLFIISLLIIIIIIFIVFTMFLLYRKQYRQKEEELIYIQTLFERDKKELREQNKILQKMSKDNKSQANDIEEKKALISLLGKRIESYTSSNTEKEIQRNEKVFAEAIYDRFCYLTTHVLIKPTEKEWNSIKKLVEENSPDFKLLLKKKFGLREDEYRVCILVWLEFQPNQILSLMDKDYAYVSKVRRKLLWKVFHIDGKPAEFDIRLRRTF